MQSCQVDLVKDGGHLYFIKFLDSPDVYAEQRAMAAFVLAVIADSHPKGQAACIQSDLVRICLTHIQNAPPGEPLLLQWLCLCLGKLWDAAPEGQEMAAGSNAAETVAQLLAEPQPEVSIANHGSELLKVCWKGHAGRCEESAAIECVLKCIVAFER
jgi:regulator-associated protein of mTOR